MSVGIGIVGLGEVSDAHIAGVLAADGADLVAVCDRDPELRRRREHDLAVSGYSHWDGLLSDQAVDGVLILLPHALHFEAARAALRAGKHVCLEKPMALNYDECHALVGLAREAGRALSVAENFRFIPAYVEIKRALEAGELGQIRLVRAFLYGSAIENYSRPDAGWRREPGGVGAVIDAAPHLFYLLRWLFGDVAQLQAGTRHWVRDNRVPALEVEDGAIVNGRLAGGAHFTAECAMGVEVPWGERVEVYGDTGSLIADQLAEHPLVAFANASAHAVPVAAVRHEAPEWGTASITAAARDFAESLAEGRPAAVSTGDAAYAVELVDCAYRSAASGGAPVSPRASDRSPSGIR